MSESEMIEKFERLLVTLGKKILIWDFEWLLKTNFAIEKMDRVDQMGKTSLRLRLSGKSNLSSSNIGEKPDLVENPIFFRATVAKTQT